MTSPLADQLYRVQAPTRTRQSDKPMSVLALGLPRSGTDSLRYALMHLGYVNCYHGFSTIDEGWADCRAWYDLLVRKFHAARPAKFSTTEFDHILADCMAVTDVPAVMFAPELLDAYPHAKVVLNRRSDVKMWKESFRSTTYAAEQSLFMWVLSFFNPELFWMEQIFIMIIDALFEGNFERNAETVYVKHYEELEAKLEKSGRDYLRWEVQQGWEPLCKYLGTDVPEIEFPRRNARANHDEIVGRLVKRRVIRAILNMLLLLVGMVVVGAAAFLA